MLVRKRLSFDESVATTSSSLVGRLAPLRAPVEKRLMRLQRTPNRVFHSANLLSSHWSSFIHRSAADVVNIHWIGAGTLSIRDVARIDKPMVMTLHDMWAFCGAEHYAPTSPSARWREGYTRGNRPVGHRGVDVDRWTWERKRRWWRPTTVVTPSRWLAELVGSSALMHDWPTSVVPYALDTTVFRHSEQGEARRTLGLPTDAAVILFGAVRGATDPRKGFDLFLEALPMVRTGDRPALGLVFGQGEPREQLRTPFSLRWLGFIRDDRTLARVYSAADVLVMPSRQENLGQTGMEAQSCGTPVVAFDAGGNCDVLEHLETGYLARAYSVEDLAVGINWVLADATRRRQLGEASRQRAVDLWQAERVARQYLDVYREAIERARVSGRSSSG
jgi:glycosyltransferase involved in cell wall biosynthesis